MMKNNWKEKAGDAIIFFICCAITLFISLLFGLGKVSFGFVAEYCIAFGIVETVKVFLTGWKYRIILFFANVCLAYYLSTIFSLYKMGRGFKKYCSCRSPFHILIVIRSVNIFNAFRIYSFNNTKFQNERKSLIFPCKIPRLML